MTLLLTAMVAVCLGCIFEWKSAWCAGACPVLAVETLYGSKPVKSFTNAHCASCQGCVMRCPDSLGSSAVSQSTVRSKRLALLLMTGGFPGFVWGWMHVPDYPLQEGWHHLAEAYGLPALGMAVSLLLFAGLRWLLPTRRRALLATLFAAASVIIYYWFRLPSLIGFSMFPNGDETLIDLRALLVEREEFEGGMVSKLREGLAQGGPQIRTLREIIEILNKRLAVAAGPQQKKIHLKLGIAHYFIGSSYWPGMQMTPASM